MKREKSFFTLQDWEEGLSKENLAKLAFSDDLTGLLNRRGFHLCAQQLLQIALRDKKKFVVLLADLDDLKKINDRYGHIQGDEALVQTARILKGRFRSSDVIARIGGDEFAVAFIVDNGLNPKILADGLEEIAHKKDSNCGSPSMPTLSIGISCTSQERRLSLPEMISEADTMMYQEKSKKQGSKAA